MVSSQGLELVQKDNKMVEVKLWDFRFLMLFKRCGLPALKEIREENDGRNVKLE